MVNATWSWNGDVNLLYFLLLSHSLCVAESGGVRRRTGEVSEHQVMEAIFADYNPVVRPVRNFTDPIRVRLDPALYAIYEVNEAQETITFSQWYRLNWFDEFLTWDPEEFGGIEMIKPRASLVWQPDLTLYGMIETTNTISPEQTLVQLNYTGHVLYAEAQNVKMHCTYDVSRFPFDHQACILHYTSWMFNDAEVSLHHMGEAGVTQYFQHNTEWSLNKFRGHREIHTYVEGVYSEVYYTIQMQRKPLYYMLNIVVPSFAITSLAIIGLFSPFKHSEERQEKVTMGLTTLLTMAVLLLMVSNEMPKTSDGMPLLGLFLMCELLVASWATVAAVCVMYLHHFGPSTRFLSRVVAYVGLGGQRASYHVDVRELRRPSGEVAALLRRVGKANGEEAAGLRLPDADFVPRISTAEFSMTESTLPDEWGVISDKVDLILLIFFLVLHALMTLCFFLPVMY